MPAIEFSKEQKVTLVHKLKEYFDKELDYEPGQFDCEFFLDFISAEIGAFYYNKGLSDAQAIFMGKMDDISDALYEIEQVTSVTNK